LQVAESQSFVCGRGHRWKRDTDHTLSDNGTICCPVCGEEPADPHFTGTLSAILVPSESEAPVVDSSATQPQQERGTELPRPAVPGYEIERELGRGGMGVVYLARQTKLNRPVALKMILAGAHASPQDRDRFRIEAQAAAQLQHPNIVQIYEIGEADGHPYLALEYVAGNGLDELLTGTPWPPREAAQLIEPLARAIHHAHEKGIIHRDLKPANILVARGEEVSGEWSKAKPRTAHHAPRTTCKITDFGLAKQIQEAEQRKAGPTQTGTVMGTPSYIAPEQARGQIGSLGPEADVYALGAILYELLTGRPPFRGQTPLDTVLQVMSEEPVPPRRLQPKVPRDLEVICLKCLEKDPGRRYGSALALAEDLRRFLDHKPIIAQPASAPVWLLKWARRRPAAASMVVMTIVVAAAALATSIVVNFQLNAAAERERKQKLDIKAEYDRAELERIHAEMARTDADKRTKEAERERTESRRSLYALQLAQISALSERDPHRALQLLQDERRCPLVLRDFTWGYLHRICQRERASLGGDSDSIGALTFAPSGSVLVSADWQGKLRIWQPQTGKLLRPPIPAHNGPVPALAFSADGKWLATAGNDMTVKLWSVEYAPLGMGLLVGIVNPLPDLRERATLIGHRGQVRCLAFSPNSKILATGGGDWTIRLWDLSHFPEAGMNPQVRTLTGHTNAVLSLAFSNDGQTLASGSEDRTIRLWDLKELPKKKLPVPSEILAGHTDAVVAVAFSPDGKTLASGSSLNDQSLRLWDVARRQERARLKGHTRAVFAVAFSPDGQTLATGSVDQTIRLWDPTTGRERTVLHGHTAQILALAFSPDNRLLASGGSDRVVRLWDLDEHREDTEQLEAKGKLGPIRFAPDASSLCFADDAHLKEMRIGSNGNVEMPGHSGAIRLLAAGGNDCLASYGVDQTVRIWQRGKIVRTMTGYPAVRALAISPNGTLLAIADEHRNVQLWDIRSGARITTFSEDVGVVSMLAFSSDGRYLASGGRDRIIRVWNTANKVLLRTLTDHVHEIRALAFAPNATRIVLASGSARGDVLLWDLSDDPPAGKSANPVLLTGHADTVSALAFTPDGKTLASGSRDRTIKLWDAHTGQERATLTGHTEHLEDLAFAADSNLLASVTSDGTIKLWRADKH
jgi:WD40 repeat protein/serine/threonine protein kinase